MSQNNELATNLVNVLMRVRDERKSALTWKLLDGVISEEAFLAFEESSHREIVTIWSKSRDLSQAEFCNWINDYFSFFEGFKE